MKKITMFHIEECRYCDFAKKAISELREENLDYKKDEIEMINENEHPEIIENYDYWSVPSLFIDHDKIFEAALFMPYCIIAPPFYSYAASGITNSCPL